MPAKKNPDFKKAFSWKQFFIAVILAGCMAASTYFWFLQPAYVISKGRLAISVGLWAVLSIGLYLMAQSDLFHVRSSSKKLLRLAIDLSLLLSLLFGLVVIGYEKAPFNLLLLPRHDVEIDVIQQDDPTKIIELVSFHSGLTNVSFSSFQTAGDWQRTDLSLKTSSAQPARLHYRGWLVKEPTFIFKTQPNGGKVKIYWDGQLSVADLSYPVNGELLVSREYGIYPLNKYSVLLFTIISLTALVFPLILQITRALDERGILFSFDAWFEETTASFNNLVSLALILSFVATMTLVASPLFTRDHQITTQDTTISGERNNVILIIVDALGAQDMSLFGYHLPTTPNLEKIAKDWTVYTNANSTATCSLSTYPTIITGRYPYFISPYDQYGKQISASPNWINLIQLLNQAGYATWWNGYMSPGFYHTGFGIGSTIFERWNTPLMKSWFQFDGVRRTTFPFIPLTLQMAQSIKEPIGWYDALVGLGQQFDQGTFKSPFFLYLHYGGTHGIPYRSGPYLGTFLPIEEGLLDRASQSPAYGQFSPERQPLANKLRLRYNEAILKQDVSFNILIEKIKQTGLYDSSMIILMGDHGQVFAHGYSSHCTPLLSHTETHVPLLIKYPNQSRGERVDSLVSTVDLAPTILDSLGISYPQNWFEGRSLLTSTQPQLDDRLIYVRNSYEDKNDPYFAVMDNQYRLVLRGKEFFLFDYKNDPSEEKNLIKSSLVDTSRVQNLRESLFAFIKKTR